MADGTARSASDVRAVEVVGVFAGPWETGWPARDGAVIGFEDIFLAFSAAAEAGDLKLATAGIDIFRDYQRIKEFLASCDVVYANCGPWAALLYLVRAREELNVRIIREVRTVGWVGYIWQEEVASRLERPGDQRVFPSRYSRDIWDSAMPEASPARVYYPMIRGTSQQTVRAASSRGTAGFFSALSHDKGFSSLPDVISRMRDAGHRIDRLILAGQRADPDLYARVVGRLSDIGLTVDYRGALPHDDVRELMAACDCIFFLTTSSIESLGRVMIEASAQRVPVVTADFGAAMDLVNVEYRIPVAYPADTSGLCDTSFPLGQLAFDRWTPPSVLTEDACYRPSVDIYLANAQPAQDVLWPPRAEPPIETRPVVFSFDCEVDGLELAEKLIDELTSLHTKPIHELVDLGGTLKHYLLANGYNPKVSFTPRKGKRPSAQQTAETV